MIVYSCILGKTDPLHEPRTTGDARFVMVTDNPKLRSKHWEIVQVPRQEAPKRYCRKLKQPSHVVWPDAEVTLWIDASYQLLCDPLELASQYPQEFCALRHHRRDRISQEAPVIVASGKGKAESIYAQLAAYQADGWDTAANPQRLITTGGFLLRRHTETVRRFNDLWHHEVQTRTLRDQMSLDYCAHKAGLSITHLPGSPAGNPFARMHILRKTANDF